MIVLLQDQANSSHVDLPPGMIIQFEPPDRSPPALGWPAAKMPTRPTRRSGIVRAYQCLDQDCPLARAAGGG